MSERTDGAERGAASLELQGVVAGYGRSSVLHGIDLSVPAGSRVALLGPNGAGKSTVLRAVSGLVAARSGDVLLDGRSLVGLPPDEIVRAGVVHVPQGRRVFPDFTVEENLRIAAYARGGRDADADLERVFVAFPRLRERREIRAGFLSGGEQQMLAIGRAVVQRPRLVMIDEMSLGLAPILVKELYGQLDVLFGGTTCLLVEQNPAVALRHCARVFVLSNGEVRAAGAASEFTAPERLLQAYTGSGG